MGLTNSVQPYCRLAIITMQMMPNSNWAHRVPLDAPTRADVCEATDILFLPFRSSILGSSVCRCTVFSRFPVGHQKFDFLHQRLVTLLFVAAVVAGFVRHDERSLHQLVLGDDVLCDPRH